MKFLIKFSDNPKELCQPVELDSRDPLISEIVAAACELLPKRVSMFVFRKYPAFLGIPEKNLKFDALRTASYYGLEDGQILHLMCSGIDPNEESTSQTKPPAYPTIPMTKEPNPSTIEASQGKALRPSRQH